jgi:hypothetical protein
VDVISRFWMAMTHFNEMLDFLMFTKNVKIDHLDAFHAALEQARPAPYMLSESTHAP